MPPATKTKEQVYIEAVGRRKTASARVRLFWDAKGKQDGKIMVNEKELDSYFVLPELRGVVISPFSKLKIENGYFITVRVQGGGARGQAEAIRHAIARALLKTDAAYRKKLKRPGFLKRDPRMKERRKFGLKKARKAPQWSKR